MISARDNFHIIWEWDRKRGEISEESWLLDYHAEEEEHKNNNNPWGISELEVSFNPSVILTEKGDALMWEMNSPLVIWSFAFLMEHKNKGGK